MFKIVQVVLISLFITLTGALTQANEAPEFDPNDAIETATLLAELSYLRAHSQEIYTELSGICSEYHYTYKPPFVEWLANSKECLGFRTIARDFLKVSDFRLSSNLPVLEKNWPVLFNSLASQCTKWKFVLGDSAELAWNDHSSSCVAFRQIGAWYLNQETAGH